MTTQNPQSPHGIRSLKLEPRHVRTLIIALQDMKERAASDNSPMGLIVRDELEATEEALVLQVPFDIELVENINARTR